jgi:hypothetical protein
MIWSDTTGKTGLVEDIDFICGTDATSYPLQDKARNANRWYYKAVVAGIKANRKWQYDDSNQSSLPISTTTLVDGQNDYELPTNLIKLEAVEVKDSAGVWHRLKHIDFADMPVSITDFQTTSGMPQYYDIVGDSLWLEAAPSSIQVTLVAGLKIYYSREFVGMVYSTTTAEPGLPESAHRILSLGASYDWLSTHSESTKATAIRAEITQLMNEYTNLNADRDEEVKKSIKPKHNQRSYF